MQNGSKVKVKESLGVVMALFQFRTMGYPTPDIGKIYTVKEYSCFKCTKCPKVHTRIILEEIETGIVENNGGGLNPDVYEEVLLDEQQVDTIINNALSSESINM